MSKKLESVKNISKIMPEKNGLNAKGIYNKLVHHQSTPKLRFINNLCVEGLVPRNEV